jgi:hypothetical protein
MIEAALGRLRAPERLHAEGQMREPWTDAANTPADAPIQETPPVPLEPNGNHDE